jgi:hypothetical protein
LSQVSERKVTIPKDMRLHYPERQRSMAASLNGRSRDVRAQGATVTAPSWVGIENRRCAAFLTAANSPRPAPASSSVSPVGIRLVSAGEDVF